MSMQAGPEPFLAAATSSRVETDYRFNWWTYAGWTILTFGTYGHYGTYKLVARRHEHVRRRLAFSAYLYQVLASRADEAGKRTELQPGLDNLARIHAEIEGYERANRRDPGVWTIVRFVFGPAGAYINHFLNADFRFLETWENAFAENVSWITARLGLQGIPARRHRTQARSTGLYVVLSIVTLGLFSIAWRAMLMRDGNDHFDEDEIFENAILNAVGIVVAPGPSAPLAPPAPPM